VSGAARRSISVSGGAPPVQEIGGGATRRGRPKAFFLRFLKKFRSILKIFL